METFDITTSAVLHVTTEDIDDIMCAALEGGINYWCCKAKVVGEYLGDYASDQISRGGTLILYDEESDCKYELNREMLLNGIALAYEGDFYKDYNWVDGNTIDACQVDAEVADCIVQLAIFGEIIYG